MCNTVSAIYTNKVYTKVHQCVHKETYAIVTHINRLVSFKHCVKILLTHSFTDVVVSLTMDTYTWTEGTTGFDMVCVQATGATSFETDLVVDLSITDIDTGMSW